MSRVWAVVAGVALLLVACGGSTGAPDVGTGTGPDSPVAVTPTGGSPGPGPGAPDGTPELVEPSPGMTELAPVPWDQARAVGPRTVEIGWWSGVRPCHVLDHVEVDSGPQRVTITLVEGSVPTDEPRACIELAVRKRTRVELEESLAGRELVDGARPATPADRDDREDRGDGG